MTGQDVHIPDSWKRFSLQQCLSDTEFVMIEELWVYLATIKCTLWNDSSSQHRMSFPNDKGFPEMAWNPVWQAA